MKIILPLLAIFLCPAITSASTDPIADLLEKYVNADGTLRETEARLKFHPIKPHSTIRMPPGFTFFCRGTTRSVTFEAKAGEYVHWGLRDSVPTGGVSYTQLTPRGSTTTTVENHLLYKACRMDPRLIEAIQKLACHDQIQATHVIVNSAFRDPIANLIEGGRSASQHLTCRAVDFALARNTKGQRNQSQYERISPALVQQVAVEFEIVRGLGRGGSFTHVDTRPGQRAVWSYGNKVASNPVSPPASSVTLTLAQ